MNNLEFPNNYRKSDQQNGLNLIIYNKLVVVFKEFRKSMGTVSSLARIKSNLDIDRPINKNSPPSIDEYFESLHKKEIENIAWDEHVHCFKQVVELILTICNESGFEEEISSNLFSIENENKGILYIQKLVAFHNEVYAYGESIFEDERHIVEVTFGNDDKNSHLFLIAAEKAFSVLSYITSRIYKATIHTVWYKDHSDILYLYGTEEESVSSNNQAPQLKWKGDKTDLAELIWALAKSGRVIDTVTNQSITQKDLTNHFLALFDLDSLDVANLMKGRYGTATKLTTYKAQEGKTFINSLQMLLNQRILD